MQARICGKKGLRGGPIGKLMGTHGGTAQERQGQGDRGIVTNFHESQD